MLLDGSRLRVWCLAEAQRKLGITGCLTELAERFNIKPRRVMIRLKYGWSPERAFTYPVRQFSFSQPPPQKPSAPTP